MSIFSPRLWVNHSDRENSGRVHAGKVALLSVKRPGAYLPQTAKLMGLADFHAVSFCGSFYPLPSLLSLCLGDALHLIEAGHGITHMRSVF
jgi:hypothetical protein